MAVNQSAKPFYGDGLHFSCIRCSDCCRLGPGFVFLSDRDIRLLAEELKIPYTQVVENYCRWVPAPGGGERLSLREKSNFDCVFWGKSCPEGPPGSLGGSPGCRVYPNRPLQCRTFPFWASALASPGAWESLDCPGVNRGEFHGRDEIESCLAARRTEPVLARGA